MSEEDPALCQLSNNHKAVNMLWQWTDTDRIQVGHQTSFKNSQYSNHRRHWATCCQETMLDNKLVQGLIHCVQGWWFRASVIHKWIITSNISMDGSKKFFDAKTSTWYSIKYIDLIFPLKIRSEIWMWMLGQNNFNGLVWSTARHCLSFEMLFSVILQREKKY